MHQDKIRRFLETVNRGLQSAQQRLDAERGRHERIAEYLPRLQLRLRRLQRPPDPSAATPLAASLRGRVGQGAPAGAPGSGTGKVTPAE